MAVYKCLQNGVDNLNLTLHRPADILFFLPYMYVYMYLSFIYYEPEMRQFSSYIYFIYMLIEHMYRYWIWRKMRMELKRQWTQLNILQFLGILYLKIRESKSSCYGIFAMFPLYIGHSFTCCLKETHLIKFIWKLNGED